MGSKALKILTGTIRFISIWVFLLGLILLSIEWAAFDLNHYAEEYERLNIPVSTGIEQKDLLEITGGLLGYLKGKRADLAIVAPVNGRDRPIFNEKEIQHMVDVKGLFDTGYRLKWISLGAFGLIVTALYFVQGREIIRGFALSYLGVLAIMGALALILLGMILIDFTKVWDNFHYIFFSNDLWILDPDKDIMIQMFPEGFFYATIMKILKTFGFLLLGLALVSGAILKKTV